MLATHVVSPPPSRADPYQPELRYDAQTLQALEVVGAEIFCVTDYLTALRRRWNSLVPVGRLPPDVLVMVMAELVLAQNAEQGIEQSRQPLEANRSWAAFSQVCDEWRTIALSTSTLWTRLDGRVLGTPMAREFLKRSASMPIEVSACGTTSTVAEAFAIASGVHRARLRVLEISDMPHNDQIDLPTGPHLLTDLPLLEELYLHTARHPTSHFVLGRLPRIRRIDVRGASFTWADPQEALSSLEALSLASIPTSAQFDARALLKLLERAPRLRELSLDHAIQHMTSLHPIMDELETAVSLPHLKRLTHAEPASEACTAVLNRLRLPAEAEVGYFVNGRWNADTCNALLNTLGEHLLQSSGWHTVELFADSINGCAKLNASSAASPTSHWPLRLSIPFGIHQGYHPHIRAALGAYPGTVRDLALFDEARIIPSTVHDAILPMRNVTTLRTYFYTLFVMKDALSTRNSDAAEAGPSHLPALETLVIRPLPKDSILVTCGIQRDSVDSSDIEILGSMLNERRKLGVPIRTIHIEQFKRFDKSFYRLASSSSDIAIFVDGRRVGA